MDTVDECPDPDLDMHPDRFLPGMEGLEGQSGQQPEGGVRQTLHSYYRCIEIGQIRARN